MERKGGSVKDAGLPRAIVSHDGILAERACLRDLHDIRSTGAAVKETEYYPPLADLKDMACLDQLAFSAIFTVRPFRMELCLTIGATLLIVNKIDGAQVREKTWPEGESDQGWVSRPGEAMAFKRERYSLWKMHFQQMQPPPWILMPSPLLTWPWSLHPGRNMSGMACASGWVMR
jgi:hypothetical protein